MALFCEQQLPLEGLFFFTSMIIGGRWRKGIWMKLIESPFSLNQQVCAKVLYGFVKMDHFPQKSGVKK